MRKKIQFTAAAILSLIIAGSGLYKANDSYTDFYSEELMSIENALAISESQPTLKFIAKHTVYKVTHKHKCYVYDDTGKKKIGEYVTVKIITGWWQTCDQTSDERYKTECYNKVCKTEACSVAGGWMVKKTDVTEGDVFISYQN